MDFQERVGKSETRHVSSWSPKKGPPILGFGVEFKNFDPMLYNHRTKAEKERVEGDAWAVEVVKCYLNPGESRTKDGRRKIHFSVRAIERVVSVNERFDWENSVIEREYICGSNRDTVRDLCDLRRARYRYGNLIFDVRVAFLEDTMLPYCTILKTEEVNALEMKQRQLLRKSFNPERFARDVNLPGVPEILRKQLCW